MLGLADRTRVIDLFDALLRGDAPAALRELRDQYDSGADPAVVLADLAEFTHFVTRVKLVPAVAEDRSLAEVERTRGRALAAALSMRVLSRTWQMLFKGLPEVQTAPKPIAAAEMVLVRIAYAADLPTPDEVIRALETGGSAAGPASASAPARGDAPAATRNAAPRMEAPRVEPSRPEGTRTEMMGGSPRAALASNLAVDPVDAAPVDPGVEPLAVSRFEDIIALAGRMRDLQTKAALERDLRLVRCEDGRLEIALEPNASRALVGELGRQLGQWTGRRWMVVVSAEQGQPTIRAQQDARRVALENDVRSDPLVQAVLAKYPGAEIVAVRAPDSTEAADAGELAPPDDAPDYPPYDDDDPEGMTDA
jgi:DNA polymerase-3 subunit gamma/tau